MRVCARALTTESDTDVDQHSVCRKHARRRALNLLVVWPDDANYFSRRSDGHLFIFPLKAIRLTVHVQRKRAEHPPCCPIQPSPRSSRCPVCVKGALGCSTGALLPAGLGEVFSGDVLSVW